MNKFEETYLKIINEENNSFNEKTQVFYLISKEINGKPVYLSRKEGLMSSEEYKFIENPMLVNKYDKFPNKEEALLYLKELKREFNINSNGFKIGRYFLGNKNELENGIKIIKVTITKQIKINLEEA